MAMKWILEVGILKRLVALLGGSHIQRDASLEFLAAIVKDNPEVASRFVLPENGRKLNVVIELVNDKNPRTRLLACTCLINIRNTSVSYRQDSGIKNKLVLILLELLNGLGQVGNEAPFVLCNLIAEKEDMQKIAFDASAVEKCYENLQKGSFQSKHLQGIFLALADMCSKLEGCGDRVLHLKQWSVFADPAVTAALGGAAATSHGRKRFLVSLLQSLTTLYQSIKDHLREVTITAIDISLTSQPKELNLKALRSVKELYNIRRQSRTPGAITLEAVKNIRKKNTKSSQEMRNL